ncbi:MAG: cupredoxin domain-containing protein [Acidimicrobiia bacterium]
MRYLAVLLAVAALAIAGCSGDEGTVIDTTLRNDAIELSQLTVDTGAVTFAVTNEGDKVHEIEVFAGSNTDLPVDKEVADVSGLRLVDEIEDILPGGNVRLTLDLPPGDYVIICNLPGHYQMGMVAKLVVAG